MNDEKDTSYIWANINSLDQRVLTYTNAKTTVESVKNTCEKQIESWKTSYRALTGNSDLSSVKKTDVFEGEMADSLSRKIADIMSDIDTGLTKAEELESALNTQMNRLAEKIAQLRTERESWVRQL
jgi:phage shock protein A